MKPLVVTSALLTFCLLVLVGCDTAPVAVNMDGGGQSPGCSQTHRDLSRWLGREVDDCGPDVTGMLELTPIGNHQLLARRRFGAVDDAWQVRADGTLATDHARVSQVPDARSAGLTLLPGATPRVLVYQPRAEWVLYAYPPNTDGSTGRALIQNVSWRDAARSEAPRNQWGHELLGLPDGYVLDRDLGDGSMKVWRFVTGAQDTIDLQPPGSLVLGPDDRFRRGHRLVLLGPGRVLEWMPRPCAAAGAAAACDGADYRVFAYSTNGGAAFTLDLRHAGHWPDIGAESELVGDGDHLFVWTRGTGRLRSYALTPDDGADPLTTLLGDQPPNDALRSDDWSPPTEAPHIKHLVVVLQDGRSFDSYFGRYCQGASNAAGEPPACSEGPACCEAMPDPLPFPGVCVDPEAEPTYQPAGWADCMRIKMNGTQMDGFGVTHTELCGDPRDVACAPARPGDDTGVGSYHALAGGGALADRFFQSYAFLDGGADSTAREPPVIPNLIYLVAARFSTPLDLIAQPLLTENLSRLQTTWAVYAGRSNLELMVVRGLAQFYDPVWTPYRSLERGELESDIAAGQLPSVAVIIPDRDDPQRSEAPGHPPAAGIGFVRGLVDAIAGSPYADDTLVLVTYLTAGGFYDHVPPPAPPPIEVDAANGKAVHFGPRVPLLALGKLARTNWISHVRLEMSSITTFAEWNWLHGTALKGAESARDPRRYRDTAVNNLGSLIVPGEGVPGERTLLAR